jgi:glutamine synthetase
MIIEQPLFDPRIENGLEVPAGADGEAVERLLKERQVRFLRLQFTDIGGRSRQVEVTASQFGRALGGEVMVDGSAVPGFARLEESDMRLVPDPTTLRLLPWGEPVNLTAAMICDVHRSDGEPFEGDPRGALKRVDRELRDAGFTARIGIETKFFLFARDAEGHAIPVPHDEGGYLDASPRDRGAAVRRDLVMVLEALGFAVEAAHHEIASGQHEVVFRYDSAVATADRLTVLRNAARQVAHRHGLVASFMPKPLEDIAGSGMHVHQSLLKDGTNAFRDEEGAHGLSDVLRFYVAGLMQHARGFCAVTNPLVNSYKRLVPGFEAPVHVSWALQNRSALIRVPASRAEGTRVELRMPDASANPYLAIAVQLAAGLDGVRNELEPGEPVQKDVTTMTARERRRLRIERLPRSLVEALDLLEEDRVARGALGEHIYGYFLRTKRAEWRDYTHAVHPWELERYLDG